MKYIHSFIHTQNCQITPKLPNLSNYLKLLQNFQNCQIIQKLSKLSKHLAHDFFKRFHYVFMRFHEVFMKIHKVLWGSMRDPWGPVRSAWGSLFFSCSLPFPALLCPNVAPSVRQSITNIGIELLSQLKIIAFTVTKFYNNHSTEPELST